MYSIHSKTESFLTEPMSLRSSRPTMTLRSGRTLRYGLADVDLQKQSVHTQKKKAVSVAAILPLTTFPIPVTDLVKAAPLTAGSEATQRIYVIRHGQSVFNVPDANGIQYISGESNPIPLTEIGKSEAREIATALSKKIAKGEKIVICSSTARRAQETADIIFDTLCKEFECQRTENESYPDICEGKNGEWE
ncbi:MAG TPA: phosphoglycerate mutase family protein, partial [Chlamydiales bacterium]|nr:phosphoglycerate mutase family protein [Chlamydiales bacterium]